MFTNYEAGHSKGISQNVILSPYSFGWRIYLCIDINHNRRTAVAIGSRCGLLRCQHSLFLIQCFMFTFVTPLLGSDSGGLRRSIKSSVFCRNGVQKPFIQYFIISRLMLILEMFLFSSFNRLYINV